MGRKDHRSAGTQSPNIAVPSVPTHACQTEAAASGSTRRSLICPSRAWKLRLQPQPRPGLLDKTLHTKAKRAVAIRIKSAEKKRDKEGLEGGRVSQGCNGGVKKKNDPVPMDFCLVCHELAKHSQQDPAGEVWKSRRGPLQFVVACCICCRYC